jgi:hypothetical protein
MGAPLIAAHSLRSAGSGFESAALRARERLADTGPGQRSEIAIDLRSLVAARGLDSPFTCPENPLRSAE